MTTIYHTVSTRTPKAQDALVNRVLDFEVGLMVSATAHVINDIKKGLLDGKKLKDFKPQQYKTPLSKKFGFSTATAYYCATYALSMYRSRDTNTKQQYLPKAESDLAKAKRGFKSLKKRLAKAKQNLDAELAKTNPVNANVGRYYAEIEHLRLKLSGSNRRVQRLQTRINRLKLEIETGQYSICLGSRKQFKAQHELAKNGYNNHDEWLKEYRFMRMSGCNMIGDPTVKGGGRQFKLLRDGDKFQLHFILSDKARERFKSEMSSPELKPFFTKTSLIIRDVEFRRAKDRVNIERALLEHAEREAKEKEFSKVKKESPAELKVNEYRHKHIKAIAAELKEQAKAEPDKDEAKGLYELAGLASEILTDFTYTKDQFARGTGCSVSPKLLRDRKGWRFDISFELAHDAPVKESYADLKVMGVDTNYDHFAISVIGEGGKFIESATLPTVHPQSNRVDNDAIWIQAAAIVDACKESGASIALESLSFSKKKQELYSARNKRYNRMLSSFAHKKMTDAIKRKALESGVEVNEVTPEYTSFLGRALFSNLTSSVHESAAYVIAVKAQNETLQKLKRSQTSFDLNQINIPVLRKGREINSFTINTYRSVQADTGCNSSMIKVSDLFYKFRQFETEQYRRSKAQTKIWRENLTPAKSYDLEIPF